MTLFENHKAVLEAAIRASHERDYYTPYPEHPKAYGEDADALGKQAFLTQMNADFKELEIESNHWVGEEISPYLQTGIGTRYPALTAREYINRASEAMNLWGQTSAQTRAGILIESLERVSKRYFEIAYATMHTTGQGFMMAFQASGPHSNDRALESIAMGYEELNRFPEEKEWKKPMGKFDLSIRKTWTPMPKGIALIIGCSTFPTWNSTPGLYAALITGNPVIVKPHPKAILPIAIVVAELRHVLKESGFNPDVVQLAPDTVSKPITKELAENEAIKTIDYTGSSEFGAYIESLGKTCFTEKAGVNPVILHSVQDLNAVVQNLAFSISLYSGQMCTAPQNIYVPESGVITPDGLVSGTDVAALLADAIKGIATHPKMGPGTLGGIQNELTIKRIQDSGNFGGEVLLESMEVKGEEFPDARMFAPKLILTNSANKNAFDRECFGPVAFVVKTSGLEESLDMAANMASQKGAITCLAYAVEKDIQDRIAERMNRIYVPVSFNFTGAAMVNSHAAFSDFHVTGGNPAGNASFTNPEFVNRRFVWVGNRYA